jgi:hypothetical protein
MRRPLPGPAATEADLRRAQARDRIVSAELPRVRALAAAWRNGLGALLVALTGFSLIKGRSDIGQLDDRWAAAVGVLLLLALVVGAAAGWRLLRAAHGRPAVVLISEIRHETLDNHAEALASAGSLRQGIGLTMICALLLVVAVGLTWYGPPKAVPGPGVSTTKTGFCSRVTQISTSQITMVIEQCR